MIPRVRHGEAALCTPHTTELVEEPCGTVEWAMDVWSLEMLVQLDS